MSHHYLWKLLFFFFPVSHRTENYSQRQCASVVPGATNSCLGVNLLDKVPESYRRTDLHLSSVSLTWSAGHLSVCPQHLSLEPSFWILVHTLRQIVLKMQNTDYSRHWLLSQRGAPRRIANLLGSWSNGSSKSRALWAQRRKMQKQEDSEAKGLGRENSLLHNCVGRVGVESTLGTKLPMWI